jgi:hypothetical protein
MEFDLKEIGVTIFIGAYFLFGIEVLLYLFFSSNVFLTIEKETRFTSRSLIVLALTLSFAFGMLIQDVSDQFVDEDTWLHNIVALFADQSSDDELKLRTLFKENNSQINPFAFEMARLGFINKYGGEYGQGVQEAILTKKSVQGIDQKQLMDVAKQLYYYAKNRVYKEATYYDDLKEIQLRIDFARSFLAISFFLIPITLGMALVKIILMRTNGRAKLGTDNAEPNERKHWHTMLLPTACIIVCLIVSCLLGTFAYISEETQFDRRAYGYFYSLNTNAG